MWGCGDYGIGQFLAFLGLHSISLGHWFEPTLIWVGTRYFVIAPLLCGHGLQCAFALVGSQYSAIGSSGLDGRGTLSASNMFIVNNLAAPPCYHGGQGQEARIDVIAASPSLASWISHWSVCTSLTLSSDHFLI